jgi:hypothetical protein
MKLQQIVRRKRGRKMQDISKIMCVIDLDSEAQPALQRSAWLATSISATAAWVITRHSRLRTKTFSMV